MTIPLAEAFGGQGQQAVSRGLSVGRADEGNWGGTATRSGSIEKPAAHVPVKDTADQGLVGNALLQGTGT